MNKGQITKGKNNSDKIKGKISGNIPRTINLRIRALPLNPKVWRKADHTYCADELYFHLLPFRRKTFSFLALTWIVFFNLFLLFNKRILLLILLTQTRQFRGFFVEILYLSKALFLMEKAGQLTVLNFNNSPITHLVALKCGSDGELVISVILNSVGKPQPTCVPCFNW